jgi:hypothetical protein
MRRAQETTKIMQDPETRNGGDLFSYSSGRNRERNSCRSPEQKGHREGLAFDWSHRHEHMPPILSPLSCGCSHKPHQQLKVRSHLYSMQVGIQGHRENVRESEGGSLAQHDVVREPEHTASELRHFLQLSKLNFMKNHIAHHHFCFYENCPKLTF